MNKKEQVPIVNALALFREKRGLSAVELSRAIGVSRQTVYAMEAGDYVPNTSVALKLARVLQANVEDLFRLSEAEPQTDAHTQQASIIEGEARPGARVQLCRVGDRLSAYAVSPVQWYFSPADGVVKSTTPQHKVKVQTFHAEHEFRNRILIAGCDPGMSILNRHAQLAGIELVLAHCNSSRSLALLNEGSVHLAGTHLIDERSGESNLPQVRRRFPANSVAVISFATWEMGLVARSKSIASVADLANPRVTIVNREAGSGSRQLLDAQLKKAGLAGSSIKGYDRLTDGHLSAAWQVRAGLADCCVATAAAARAFDLHFTPWVSERYDLVLRRKQLATPAMQIVLETLNRLNFRRELNSLGGYDTAATGQRVM
jgi:putative molybdopterin biosynthesis protein